MCDVCGCSESKEMLLTNLQTGRHVHLDLNGHETAEHSHSHSHEIPHVHRQIHSHPSSRSGLGHIIRVEESLLKHNDVAAQRNREWFQKRGILALNFMSSPGAGKTTILERLLRELSGEKFYVVEGDQATLRDAERIHATGAPVVQVNTGASCHLTAESISAAVRQLNPTPDSTVIIENVGNLVCPALFDLGQQARIVVASVTEGDDKPLKYPHMFRVADLVLLNKIDLAPHVDFQPELFEKYARERNPDVEILRVSAKTPGGLNPLYLWLRGRKHLLV